MYRKIFLSGSAHVNRKAQDHRLKIVVNRGGKTCVVCYAGHLLGSWKCHGRKSFHTYCKSERNVVVN